MHDFGTSKSNYEVSKSNSWNITSFSKTKSKRFTNFFCFGIDAFSIQLNSIQFNSIVYCHTYKYIYSEIRFGLRVKKLQNLLKIPKTLRPSESRENTDKTITTFATPFVTVIVSLHNVRILFICSLLYAYVA